MTSDERPTRVSRRRFLAAAGGTVAGATIGAPFAAAGERVATKTPKKWNSTVDVVVVGSGAAAFAAAVTARSKKRTVVMLEKADAPGGTTAKSGGVYWIPNNSLLRAKGLSDPRDDAIAYMCRASWPQLYDRSAPRNGLPAFEFGLIGAYYDNAATAVDALSALGSPSVLAGAVSGNPNGDPDYHADFVEDKTPRGRHVAPANGKGGAGLIEQLQIVAKKQGIAVQLSSGVEAVYRNARGQVIGVRAKKGAGTTSIRARRAVVFGSGGFTQNPDLRRHFLRGPIFGGCAVPTNTGDFVEIGIQLGAQLGNMNNAYWAQNPLEQALQNSSVPNDIWIPYGDSMVQVNKFGKRVVNEKITYNERTQAHFMWDATHREYSNNVLMMIYDSGVAGNPLNWPFRYPLPLPGVASPLVISGNTWEELAAAIDARLARYTAQTGNYRLDASFVANLKETIARFNSFAASGVDLDFRRGETPIQVAWHGPARAGNTSGNPTMFPFSSSGPYYCILIGGGTLDTKGGPVINAKGQVLDTALRRIPGLYGAGNCIASPSAQAYWSAGGTIGPALTFGYLSGLNAAAEAVKAA